MAPKKLKRLSSDLPGPSRKLATAPVPKPREEKYGFDLSDSDEGPPPSPRPSQSASRQQPTRVHRQKYGFDLSDDDDDNDNLDDVDADELLPLSNSSDSDILSDEDIDMETNSEDKNQGGELLDKNKNVWKMDPPTQSRRRKFNIVQEAMGPRGMALDGEMSPSALFKLFLPSSMVQTIIGYTNANGVMWVESLCDKIAAKISEGLPALKKAIPDWKVIDEDEFYSFIGVLLLVGVERHKHQPIKELWTSDPLYQKPPIIATMSRDLFVAIQRFIRFDDAQFRRARKTENNPLPGLTAVSGIFDPFVDNIQSNFSPGFSITVDEMLIKFRGRTTLRVYMKSKPGKYGVKAWVAVDSETGYVLRMKLYEGKVGNSVENGLGNKL